MRWQSLCTSRHRGSGFGWVCMARSPQKPCSEVLVRMQLASPADPQQRCSAQHCPGGIHEEEGGGRHRALESSAELEGRRGALRGTFFLCAQHSPGH